MSPRARVSIDVTSQGIKLVELVWRRNSPFLYWTVLYALYRSAWTCRNGLNNGYLKLLGHHPLRLKHLPRTKVSSAGFWRIESLVHRSHASRGALNGEIRQQEELAKALAVAIQKANGGLKEVSLSIEPHLVFQLPLGPVATYFGANWQDQFDPLPQNQQTMVLQDHQALVLTQQLISEQDLTLPIPINQAFLMYLIDPGITPADSPVGGSQGQPELKDELKDELKEELVMVACRRGDINSREQLLKNLHLRLQVLEPSINAALRAIGYIDQILARRLVRRIWIWISLENDLASVLLIEHQQRLEGHTDLTSDALQSYLNSCIGWAGADLQDIVVSGHGELLSTTVKEVIGSLDIGLHAFTPQLLSQLPMLSRGAAGVISGQSNHVDWLVALGLALGLAEDLPEYFAFATRAELAANLAQSDCASA
jgi:hypothetical protein